MILESWLLPISSHGRMSYQTSPNSAEIRIACLVAVVLRRNETMLSQCREGTCRRWTSSKSSPTKDLTHLTRIRRCWASWRLAWETVANSFSFDANNETGSSIRSCFPFHSTSMAASSALDGAPGIVRTTSMQESKPSMQNGMTSAREVISLGSGNAGFRFSCLAMSSTSLRLPLKSISSLVKGCSNSRLGSMERYRSAQ